MASAHDVLFPWRVLVTLPGEGFEFDARLYSPWMRLLNVRDDNERMRLLTQLAEGGAMQQFDPACTAPLIDAANKALVDLVRSGPCAQWPYDWYEIIKRESIGLVRYVPTKEEAERAKELQSRRQKEARDANIRKLKKAMFT